jgi:hypothetical protein
MKVLVLDKEVFDLLLSIWKIDSSNVENFWNIKFISILSSNRSERSYFKTKAENVRILRFDNVRKGEPNAITKEQAFEIHDFLWWSRIKTDMVIIHCNSGLARSKAVAQYIASRFPNPLELGIIPVPQLYANMDVLCALDNMFCADMYYTLDAWYFEGEFKEANWIYVGGKSKEEENNTENFMRIVN